MRKAGFLSTFLLFITCNLLIGQVNYADRLYEENSFEDAAVLYERAYNKDTSDLHIIQRLGHCYQKLNKYELSEKYFARAVKYDDAEPESHLHYGQLLKNQNKIRQARNQFEEFLKHRPESLLGKILLQSCDAISDWTAEPSEFELKNLKAVNTEFIEIAPFPIPGKLLFSSDKNYISKAEDKEGKFKKSLDGMVFGIYYYDSTDKEIPIRSFAPQLNSEDDSEGPAYLSKDGNTIFYNKVFDRQRMLVNQIELHIGHKKENGDWEKLEKFPYNGKDFSITNPVLSFNQDILYFSSDRPGGYGGMDIYLCTISGNTYSEPVNLGNIVNTSENEIPSYADESGVLYFSSDFHPGFGGFDIFKTTYTNGIWNTPENLKVPFNSTKDELGYIKTDSVTGYFASNRDGGIGLDDIYYFTKHYFSDSSYYTDISGLFLFDTLPLMNMSLTLLDENDEIIQTAVTNEKGQFTFENVPANVNYKILINEEPDKVPDEAKVYLTDDRYNKIMLIERLQKGLFKFQALERDEYAGLSLMDEVDDNGFPTLRIDGQLSSENEQTILNDKRVYVIDSEGNILASTISDHLGKFHFEKLTIDNEYLFRLEETDTDIDIQILNKEGNIVGRTLKNKDGVYVYHKFTINPSISPDLRGVFKFGNLPADGVKLMLLDENDDIVKTTTTNVKGEFEFLGLKSGNGYKIVADSTKKIPGNATLFLMDKHTGMLVPVSKLANGTFKFETLAPLPAEELALMDEEDYVIKPRHNLQGEVINQGNNSVPAGLVVQVLDENGKIVAVAKTNEKGMFKFYNLPLEDQYLFHIPEDDANYKINVLNEDNVLIGETMKNDNNLYVYHKFTINPSKRPDIRGLFKYGNLPANDITLNLLSEGDEVLQVTQTNAMGEFSFKKLFAGKSYRIQVDPSEGQVPENASMFILDEYTGLMLPVSRLNNGQFEFETLSPMEAEDISLMNEEDETAVRFSFFAQLFSKLPMDFPEGMEIYIVDDEGNIISTARTDRFGKFNYEKLPLQDNYLIRISEDDPNFELKVISKEGVLIGVLKRNANGDFVFNREELYKNVAETDKKKFENLSSAKNTTVLQAPNGEFKPVVNFAFGGYELNDDIRKNLDFVVYKMKNESDISLEISSHTDSRGPAEYNLFLSEKRANAVKSYLVKNAIPENRVIVKSYGETKLLNECSDDVNCSGEKHAVNRRVELRYLK